MNWEAIKEMWPFALLIGGHVVRTERQRAVFAEKHRASEKSRDEDREMLKEIRADIKNLLEQKK